MPREGIVDDPRDEYPDTARGVFETVLVRDGRAQALDLHLERLTVAAAELYGQGLPSDLTVRLRTVAGELRGSHRLRVCARPESDRLALAMDAQPVDVPDPRLPVRLKPLTLEHGLGRYKWLDRRLIDACSTGPEVPLFLDAGGCLLEAAWANVWLVEAERIVTPPTDGRLLPGITRARLLRSADASGLIAVAEPIPLARAEQADAIFLTSSLRQATPAVLAGAQPNARGSATVDLIRTVLSQTCWDEVP